MNAGINQFKNTNIEKDLKNYPQSLHSTYQTLCVDGTYKILVPDTRYWIDTKKDIRTHGTPLTPLSLISNIS